MNKKKETKGKLRLSNNILFVLAIALILANSYTFISVSKDHLTGKASSEGTTRICIGAEHSMTAPTPLMPTVLNSSFNSTVNGNNMILVNFYYYYSGIGEQLFGIDNDSDDDDMFNATLNVSSLPDGNCNYRILARGESYCSQQTVKGSATFSVNNIDVPPIWTEFNNSESTNFSEYTSWADISSAKIALPPYGEIGFTATNLDSADLDYMFEIEYNNITLNVSYTINNCLNDVPFVIKIYNVSQFAEPVVFKNNAPCNNSCQNMIYDGENVSFVTTIANEFATFSIREGGTLTINWTFRNKTYDNSPTITFTTYMLGQIKNVTREAYCTYKTDYDPTEFTAFESNETINHTIHLSEQNWSYLPTNMGHYPNIQHYAYYSGLHTLTINCSVYPGEIDYQEIISNQTFLLTYTERDRVYYSDGDLITLFLPLEEENLIILADFSQVDSSYTPSRVNVTANRTNYTIQYNISSINTFPDGQYNITIEAYHPNGTETMNGTIFVHLHNIWTRPNIDDAFDCWNFKQGYYFDEVACDWESDVNHVADRVDVYSVEIDCFDGMDNDGDCCSVMLPNGTCIEGIDSNNDGINCSTGDLGVDYNDTDCAGIWYDIRRDQGIDSAFLADPCFNNICRVCVGDNDNNNDGICDSTAGVSVCYLNKVRPGEQLKVNYSKNSITNQSVRVSVNYLPRAFNISNESVTIRQLPRMELGLSHPLYVAVTATTFGQGLPDSFTGNLREKLTIQISPTASEGTHPEITAAKSIEGNTAFQNMIFFEVSKDAIVNESNNASYCFDSEDNDMNDITDCRDLSCNLTVNPANSSQRCEYPREITCNDGFDNDMDGFTDCDDNDCFQKNGTAGPCYAVENYAPLSCSDRINNDFDWGLRCDPALSVSYQTRQANSIYSNTIRITDCLDIDCDGQIGNATLLAVCEYCHEKTCNDGFDNDADMYYDCTGNAYRSNYERDCDRWHNIILTCPMTETICSDNLDNDLDSDSPNGEYSWLGIPVYGGWDCQDLDCNGLSGNVEGDVCQWRNETICDDGFDNDRDGLIDCHDPTSCKWLGGTAEGFPGLCRPCPAIENISLDSCRDSDDTDYDSDTDCADPDCIGLPGPGTGRCGLTETNCTDGIDNDLDLLIDMDDPDCAGITAYTDELGPGQCNDGLDNDLDGLTDCQDPDCANTMICRTGSWQTTCSSLGYVGAINVCRTAFVPAGRNVTFTYTRLALSTDSVVLKAGNTDESLRDISPTLDDSTSFMTGSAGFVKVNDTYGLKAQKNGVFSGNLNLSLISTTGASVLPGLYSIFVSTSIVGIYGTKTATVYIAENEPPDIEDIIVEIGDVVTGPGTVNVTMAVNATDQGTYNSGIAFCTMNLSGLFYVNSTRCSMTVSLAAGTYNISAIAYDGALNPSSLAWEEFTVSGTTRPAQQGDFYNTYPAENYPDKKHFNDTEKLNIGINFEGGSGFTANSTGCIIEIMNSTETLVTQYVDLSVVSGNAVCTGQVNLSELYNLTKTNRSSFPAEVYYFTVSVYDDAMNKVTSAIQDINFCLYYYDNSSLKNRCGDECYLKSISNRAPVFLTDIPNQTWPRGTSLSTIDLDDYFYDPDGDPLLFTWTIDSTRINVSIDASHMVTFTPDTTFYGFAHITFIASDLFDSASSNLITLEIVFRPFPETPPIPAGGGGGGGGGAVNKTEMKICEEDWRCTDWGICFPSSYQFRQCRDQNECGTTNKMPNTTRECLYTPTCRDKIKNQGEEQVDCGGPCPPCPSCKDRILNQQEEKTSQQMSADPKDISDCGGPLCPACPTCQDNTWNQDEEGIDCGGPCRQCATCEDRVRNQGEVNIDCGGPCPSCSISITETAFNWNVALLLASLPFLLLLIVLALLFGVFKKKFIRLKARLLNYHLRLVRMFEKKKAVEHELHINQWVNSHLDSIQESASSKTTEELVNSVDRLVRIFFKRVFLIRYAFTNDELVKELEKHRIPAVLRKATEILFEELSQIKYAGEEVNKDDLTTIINQVKVITERLVTEIETKKKTKINMSERDIMKISETLQGAHELSVKEAVKRMKR